MSSTKREIDFKRGKSVNQTVGPTKTPLAVKSSLSADQLFEVRKRRTGLQSNEPKLKRVKRKKNSHRSEDMSEDTDRVVIESMSLSRLPEGMVVYACIQDISDFEIKFCLCGGIVAKVSITNICHSYTLLLEAFARNDSAMASDIEVLKPNGMFKIGQYFPIKILSKSEKSKGKGGKGGNIDITASLNPRHIYSDSMASSLLKVPQIPVIAAIDSVEDHGFVMDIGFDDIKAFLPKDKAQTAIQTFKGRKSLSVGQLVFCAIDSVVNERSVRLTTNSKTISKFKLTADKEVGFGSLIPGLTVCATVMNVTERGLELNILNEFKGFVTRNHMKTDWDLPKNMYKIGDKIEGTILYRHPITKQIAVSLKPKLESKAIKSFLEKVKIGSTYEKAIVMGRDDMGNVVFKLPNEVKGICHKKHLFDKQSDDVDLETTFGVGSEHKCRVKAINLMDRLVGLTLKQSLLETPTISVNDLEIGSIIKGKVKKVVKNGVIIEIGFGLKGFVPNIHLAETAQIKNREQLFPNGKVVKCRVFKMNRTSSPPKVSLTCKKSLVSQKLNLLASYEDAKTDFQTDGVVVLIVKKGVLVEFFNEVKGFIPLKYLSSYRIEYPEKLFTIGQMVRCSVVSTDVEKERITCSLIGVKADKNTKNSKLIVGQLLKALKVSNKSDNGFDLVDHSNEYKVFIPFAHLSDDIHMSSLLSQALSVGDVIKEVVVFTTKANLVIVSRKQTFINAVKNDTFISSVEALEPNLIVPVIINGFTSYGIFVELPANIKGLVPKRYLIDGPIDEPKHLGFALHQTVFARFIEFEEQSESGSGKVERKKLAFSLKLSHVWNRQNTPFEDRVQLFNAFLNDMDLTLDLLHKNSADTEQKVWDFRIGRIVFYRVIEVNELEIICEVKLENEKRDNWVKAVTKRCETDVEKELKIGSSGNAVVVNIDFSNKRLEIMIRHKLVKQVKNSFKINAISSVKCDQIIKCQTIYICDQFVLALLSGHAPGVIAYIPSKRHLNDIKGISHLYSFNEFYHIIVKSISNNKVIAVLNSETEKCQSKSNRVTKKVMNFEKEKQKNETKRKNESKVMEENVEQNEENHSDSHTNETNKEFVKNERKKRKRDSESETEDSVKQSEPKANHLKTIRNTGRNVLKVNQPFVWDVDEATPDLSRLDSFAAKQLSSDSESDETDSEDKSSKRKKSRKERNEESKHMEELIRKKEELLMDSERRPETVDDFERAVLASPNSSLVWLKYMAFHLEATEVSKARAVAERAIKTITFREEGERLNVWVAYLNLENLYGTQQTLDEVFERALQLNEPIVIYNHLANIYSKSNKQELTEDLFTTMTKKFRQNKSVWIAFGLFYMKNSRLESARKLMQRSLTCLEKRDHIEVISKFAQMEFRFGDVEHGKTLFENVLANFPKRIDLWSVYIDMMLKYGIKNESKESEDSVRNIFERVITFKLSAKRMKFIFKRYIDFEKQLNNDQRIDRIKQKALEYVEGNPLIP